MDRPRQSRGALLINNLPQLQNLVKRDPEGYREEFLQQWNHYDSIRCLFEAKPDDSEGADRFRELLTFITQVCHCYKAETKEFPGQLMQLLMEHYGNLNPELRKTMVQNLVLLRNKDIITSIELLKVLFPLLPRTSSSELRSFIRTTILTDIKTANAKTKNHKLNKAVQVMLFGMVERGMDGEVTGDKGKARCQNVTSKSVGAEAMWAVMLAKELWRKGVWNDAKTVSIVALGCFHPVTKVQNACVHFFLGSEDEIDESEDEDNAPDMRKLVHQRQINKKTKGAESRLVKAAKKAKKARIAKQNGVSRPPNFPALQLLHDPQSFGENLYAMINKHDKRFSLDHKILLMQLLSRVMGVHKLCVLPFYPYITRYLNYHQLRVTSILVCLAQSVHDLTPPDVLTPVIRKIAHEFVTPGVAAEVVAAGLNSIREVCRRQPWCMEEDLLSDLIEYRKSKDKGVLYGARGLLALFRDVNPGLLKKSERGRRDDAEKDDKVIRYGQQQKPSITVEGLQLLEDHFAQLRAEEGADASAVVLDDDDDDAAWDGWEVESETDSDSSGWKDVSSDDDDIVISDSEDEKDVTKSAKTKVNDKDTTMNDTEEPKIDAETTSAEPTTTLATTKILTPADFALLNELRLKAAESEATSGHGKSAKRKLAELQAIKRANADGGEEAFLSEADLLGPRKKAKATYEERVAAKQAGQEGREFGSKKGKKNKANPSSSTNREKRKHKPAMMVLASQGVRSKKTLSLVAKQKKLRKHIETAKKAHH
ncbi:Severe Depolymerization of Actin [Tulasnella sp. 403]|nr:Severe Depolymerization of Actin [Tulasnella sp. 403]